MLACCLNPFTASLKKRQLSVLPLPQGSPGCSKLCTETRIKCFVLPTLPGRALKRREVRAAENCWHTGFASGSCQPLVCWAGGCTAAMPRRGVKGSSSQRTWVWFLLSCCPRSILGRKKRPGKVSVWHKDSPEGAHPFQTACADVGVEGQHLLSPEKGVEKQRLSWQGRGCFSEHALAQGLLCLSRGFLPNS